MHVRFDLLVAVDLFNADDIAVEANELLERAPQPHFLPIVSIFGNSRLVRAVLVMNAQRPRQHVPLHDANSSRIIIRSIFGVVALEQLRVCLQFILQPFEE